ncbi:tetratricopeptide (TPR) repeat protein [Paenibacillus phyllosphaerae]|uniref:Tetratricopeptide (TPR) repeat protein n=1 Tax=Paenibacillus phyllosphaerae TaxID=274593 RepID=A0A7W5ATV6_9BACL|nr:O-antigen ligase family protein [Paenibacillus phyllosphaerae]MBB3108512.1 tetratricopeptide (TPR) repeat protein [Paenibacillus phyllosphaerae]
MSLAAIWLTALIIIVSYRMGMFFDSAFFYWEGFMAITPLASIGTAWGLRKLRGMRSGAAAARGDDPDWRRIPLAAYGLFAIAICYGLSLLGHPASREGTIEQALRYTAYGAFLWTGFFWFAGRERPGHEQRRKWIPRRTVWLAVMQLSGLFVLGGALAGWMGWLHFPNLIMVTEDAELSASGARLAGFVQYPNTLGALAAAYLLCQWRLMAYARTKAEFLVPSAMSTLSGLVLLLTESRGAWIAALLGWLLAFVFIGRKSISRWLVFSGVSLIGIGVVYRIALPAVAVDRPATLPGSKAADWQLILLWLAGLLVLIGLFVAIQRLEPKLRIWQAAIFWGMSSAAAIAILPRVASGRLEGHYDTAAARTLFYWDSLKLISEAPLFGRGGDTWRMLFRQIQSQPYVGNEVHSGYLDIVLDLGIVGACVFLLVLAALLLRVWRCDRSGLIPIGVLLLHAGVDFDLSYGCYWLILIGFIVMHASDDGHSQLQQSHSPSPIRVTRAKSVCAIAALILLFVSALGSWRLDEANTLYETSSTAADEQHKEQLLREALERNPNLTQARLDLAELIPLPSREALLLAGLSREPDSPRLLFALGKAAAAQGQVPQAVAWMEEALRLDRYHAERQTKAVSAMVELAIASAKEGKREAAIQAAQAAVAMDKRYAQLTEEPLRVNGRRFERTEEAEEAAARSSELLQRLAP